MNCFTAKACGRWLPLLSITLQGCTSFRHLTFHSVHCHPPASATLARMLPSFHCTQANPQFHSAPLWLFQPTFRNSKPKREAAFHPTQFVTLHSVTTLAFPVPVSGMSCEVFTPENQKPQKIPTILWKVGKKIEDYSRMALCLQPVRLTHSTVPFVPHYTISFVHLTSFSTARVSVSCLNTHTFPTHNSIISAYFYLRIVCPIKPVPDHCRFVQPSLIVSSCYWNENNCPRTSRCQLFPNSTAHHHTRNLPFPHRKPKRIYDVGNK